MKRMRRPGVIRRTPGRTASPRAERRARYCRRLCPAIAPVLLFFMTLAGCTGGGTIPIGFSGQLTGVHSDLGVAARNGAQLAVERVQEQGGVAGKRLELIVENDENTPEGALEADRKLIERGVVAIIGHMTSTQTLAALPMLRKEGVPLVSPTTSTPLLSGKKDNFFRLNSSSERSAAVMGKYACEQLGTQHVGVVYDTGNEAYTLPYTDTFIESARAHGAETFERIPFDSEAADSASTGDVNRQKMIERLEAAGCDTVLVVASAADTALFAQALAESALDVHLLGSGWAYTDSLLRYGGEAVEGIRFTDTFSREGGNEAFTEFARAYEERYGNEPNFAAAHGYETVYFLRKGLKRTGGKAEGLIEALSSIERLEGFTGTLKFDEYGEVYRPVFISRVENGEFNMVNKIDAVFPE